MSGGLGARFAAFALLLCFALRVGADDRVDFFLSVDAPRPLANLLKDHLGLAQATPAAPLPRAQFERLYESLQQQAEQLLASEGYYAPKIDIARTSLANDSGWRIGITVDPGPLTHVAEVELQLNGAVAQDASEAAAARARWGLKGGAAFRQAEWETAKRNFLRGFLLKRYPHARLIRTEARVDPATSQAHLIVQVDSGPAVSFGALSVVGLERYPNTLVTNMNPIEPGTPYDQTQMLTLQTRLQDSGYFKTVEVRTVDVADDPTVVPIHVQVTEHERRQVGFGVGFSTDVGPRAKADYQDWNVRERAWHFKSGVEVDRVQQTVSAGVDLPMKANGARDGVATSYTHKNVSGEITDTARVGVTRAERIGLWERVLSLQYQTEIERVIGAPRDVRQALVANGSWTRRATDDLLYPARGYLLNAQLGGAHDALLSDRSFVRAYGKAARYYPVHARASLMFRGELGAVAAAARTGIPVEYLFKTGGDQTVRGYAYQSIGAPDADGIAAGRYLAVASSEYTYWFRHQWGAALFYDIGTAGDARAQLDWFAGYGSGVRWRSPVGPVSLDVAYGVAVRKYRVHFSLGFVF